MQGVCLLGVMVSHRLGARSCRSLLASAMRHRPHGVRASWVKGHARDVDVELGRMTLQDKKGNDGADQLAVAGAALHQVPADIVQLHRCAGIRRSMFSR